METNGSRHPGTAKKLIHVIGANLSTLNPDINLTRKMPSILPGNKGVRNFVEALRESLFPNIANTIEVVHIGETRSRRGKRFPSRQEAEAFSTASAVLADMACAVGENAHLLDKHMTVVPEGHYRGGRTKVGELVLTFYELYLQVPSSQFMLEVAVQRVRSLAGQEGFVSSSLMLQALTGQETVSRRELAKLSPKSPFIRQSGLNNSYYLQI